MDKRIALNQNVPIIIIKNDLKVFIGVIDEYNGESIEFIGLEAASLIKEGLVRFDWAEQVAETIPVSDIFTVIDKKDLNTFIEFSEKFKALNQKAKIDTKELK